MPASRDMEDLFDAEFLRRLEALSLLARKIQRGSQRAERRSIQRGASIEFAEYRPFVSGDDIRHVDWNAFARWRQLVMKVFVEEEDLAVHLLLDGSASMNFGSPSKFDHARQIVAGLAYLALANLDRMSLTLLGHPALGPSARGKHRFLQILRYLGSCETLPGHATLESLAQTWTASRPRRGLVVWVSDLWGRDPRDVFKALDRLRHARHEVAIIQVRDPAESQAGTPGEYEFQDCETGEIQRVIVSLEMARRYREKFQKYEDDLAAYARRHQISLLVAETSTPATEILQRALLEGGFVK